MVPSHISPSLELRSDAPIAPVSVRVYDSWLPLYFKRVPFITIVTGKAKLWPVIFAKWRSSHPTEVVPAGSPRIVMHNASVPDNRWYRSDRPDNIIGWANAFPAASLCYHYDSHGRAAHTPAATQLPFDFMPSASTTARGHLALPHMR